jgi:kinesin family member 6/9
MNRAIGAHTLNKESSRSHCIFTVRVESKSLSSSNETYTLSKLNLVDLAGSERLAKTQVLFYLNIGLHNL